jgi:TolA-binding protein
MKFKGLIFSLCFLFAGAAMADAAPDDAANAPRPAHRRVRKKRIHTKKPLAARATPAAAVTPDVAAVAQPEPPKTSALQAWLAGMKKRLSQTDTHANKLVAVAAVRGAETSDVPPLYWKGKRAEVRDDVPERKDFEAAIDIALKGDNVAAKERLQSFLLAYPKSSYASDAQETLNRLDNNN